MDCNFPVDERTDNFATYSGDQFVGGYDIRRNRSRVCYGNKSIYVIRDVFTQTFTPLSSKHLKCSSYRFTGNYAKHVRPQSSIYDNQIQHY